MNMRLLAWWDRLRSTFWFVPSVLTCAAAVLALAMLALDAALGREFVAGLGWVYTGGPEGARALLSTVASSVITVAGTTFSITIAALTLASSQFGPRLLRNFVRDRGNQVVLGTFIATFLYCLLVLRTVRGLEDTRVVPHLSVTVAVMLAVASLGVLIYFIHHVATTIQADHVIAQVAHELDAAIPRLFPAMLGDEAHTVSAPNQHLSWPQVATHTQPVLATQSAYLQLVDSDALLHVAVEHDLVLRLCCRPGDFVVAGSKLLDAAPRAHVDDAVNEALRASFVWGMQRTQQQDVRFTINQLVEVAVRALSPGINDPFTAITCIERLGAALARLAERAMPGPYRYDEAGKLRVITPEITFHELVGASCDQIRSYGRNNMAVTLRLLAMLATVSQFTHTAGQRAALLEQVSAVAQDGLAALTGERERRQVAAYCDEVAAAISEVRTNTVPHEGVA